MKMAAIKVAAAAGVLLVFSGCANKVPEPEYRPLQIRWIPDAGQKDENMPTKDNCVIRLTAKLMGEEAVQASPVEEISYNVAYGQLSDSPGTLYFTGACVDSDRAMAPECRWSATCDQSLEVVVKFHNGV